MVALILVAVVACVAVLALAAVALASRLAAGPSLAERTVTVHTRDDQNLRGVLVAQHSDRWSLREVVYLFQSGDQPVPGVVHVPVANIAWAQEASD